MKKDDIELPPLPPLHIAPSVEPVDYPEVAQALMDYARAAIEPYQKRIAELEAVLQSPEIRALQKDVVRYRWLRGGGNDEIGVVMGFDCIDVGATVVFNTYGEGLDGEHLDGAIDAAMEQQP